MGGFNIKRNAVFSALGFGVAIAAQLVIFRLAEARIGLASIGFFALVQGLMLFARAFETGVGQNITRRIALAMSASERWAVIYAGLILILGPTLLLSMFSFWAIGQYVAWSHPEMSADLTQTLVGISVFIALTSASNAVMAAALDGVGMMISRNVALALAFLVATASAVPLLTHYGAAGYGAIFLVATGGQLVLSTALFLWKSSAGLRTTPAMIWQAIKSMWVENLAMNGSGLARLTFEPMTRVWLAEFANLSAVGLFDILSRLVIALRSLIQTAINPLLYVGARDHDALSPAQTAVFAQAQRLIASVAAHVALAATLAAPAISIMLFGDINPDAVRILSILALSAAVNLLGVVGYYVALSGGQVGRILSIHLIMLVLNLGLGPALGWWFGLMGVVYAYGTMMAVGGVFSLGLMRPVNGLNLGQSLQSTWHLATQAAVVLVFLGGQSFGKLAPEHDMTITIAAGCASLLVSLNLARILLDRLRARKALPKMNGE